MPLEGTSYISPDQVCMLFQFAFSLVKILREPYLVGYNSYLPWAWFITIGFKAGGRDGDKQANDNLCWKHLILDYNKDKWTYSFTNSALSRINVS